VVFRLGYDQTEEKVILHTGETQAHEMSYALFERVWQRGHYWILALLESEQEHAYLDPFNFTKAAHDILTVGLNSVALKHSTTATKVWPQEWLPYFLLGNYYLNISDEAASWFSKGYRYAYDKPEYLNNYSDALVQEGYYRCKKIITAELKISPEAQNLLSIKNEFDLIPTSSEISLQENYASYAL
jgi:hypothetical protein